VEKHVAEFDKQIADESDKSGVLKLQVSRKQMVNYATLPLDAISKGILSRLDE
jgi:hypothetical protein